MPMTGDGRLTAKVDSQTQTPSTSNPAKAGVMFRETLAAGSIHGMADFMKANGSEFHWRLTTNGPSAGHHCHDWHRGTVLGADHPGRQRHHGRALA